MNSINLVARLTRDPESRVTTSGTSICSLSVAVNERRKDGEEYVSYLDVDCFGTLADNCALYLQKGRQVAISGRLRQERWEKNGEKRSKVKIVAHDVQFLGARTDTKPDAFDEAKAFVGGEDDTDDLPF